MAIERERKFLVNNFPKNIFEESDDIQHLIQMYIVLEEDHEIRMRIINGKQAILTYKKYLSPTDRIEIEYDTDIRQAVKTFNEENYICCLEKSRLKYYGWDVDQYPNGFMVAEYEYSDKNPFPETLPSWIGEEITGQYEYSNICIARNFKNYLLMPR